MSAPSDAASKTSPISRRKSASDAPFGQLPRQPQTLLARLQRGRDVAKMQESLGEKCLEQEGWLHGTGCSRCV